MFECGTDLLRVLAVRNLDLFFALAQEAGIEGRRLRTGEVGVNRPVLFFLKRLDLALTVDDQPQSNGQHAASLLRVHQVAVNIPRLLESGLYSSLSDFIEGDATDTDGVGRYVFLGFLFLPGPIGAELVGKMRGNRFPFAVGIGRKVDGVGREGQLLELG